jgi:mannose-6-phosphate isomerase-like protein (cupin superfamily)
VEVVTDRPERYVAILASTEQVDVTESRYASGENGPTFDPPPDGGRPASDAVIREPGAGGRMAFGPGEVMFKAEGAGWLSLMETTLGPGYRGPVPHFHRGFVDSFYVLEGVLTLRVGDAVVEAPAGSFTAATPGTVHTFSNPGDEPVRMLNVMAPGGFEQYLREVAAEVPAGGAPDPALMAEIAQRHDFVPAA